MFDLQFGKRFILNRPVDADKSYIMSTIPQHYSSFFDSWYPAYIDIGSHPCPDIKNDTSSVYVTDVNLAIFAFVICCLCFLFYFL